MLGADAAQIVERGVIARQQKMIAVVDRHADRGVVIGAAAAAGECGRLVHDDVARRARRAARAADRPARPAPMMWTVPLIR